LPRVPSKVPNVHTSISQIAVNVMAIVVQISRIGAYFLAICTQFRS
jgi:hypothetical protein